MNNAPLLTSLRSASASQRNSVTISAGTSVDYLYQLAGGSRVASAELAAKIEHAVADLRRGDRTVAEVKRTDLCPACAACEYAQEHA
jgi:hypothetical protein